MRRTGITRSVAAVVMGSLTLAACGGSSDSGSGPSATATPPAATTPAPTEPQTTTEGQPEPEPAPEPETTSEPGDEPAVDEPAVDDEPAAEPDAPPAAVWPDDGCSADNSPTPAAVAEGPAPAIELRPESVDGPLPDLAVRRLNCKGGWENLRNELPADRPLLVWFWAPH
jgi:hypothetical protein